MRSTIRVSFLFLLALALGVILAPHVYSIAYRSGNTFQGGVSGLIQEMQSYAQSISPATTALVPTILAGAGALAGTLFLYLLLFVPIRLYSIQRAIRKQGEQIDSLKREIYLSSNLFSEARKNYRSERESDKAHPGTKSEMHRFKYPGLHEDEAPKEEVRH